MKTILIITFFFLTTTSYSQNFLREKYNHYFPNNKSIQIAKLQVEKDSIKRSNDSLNLAQLNALEKINHLKKEVLTMKTDMFNEQSKSKDIYKQLENDVSNLKDSITKISFPLVICKEEIIVQKGSTDPEIINTCLWRTYKIIEKGTPDYKGRYKWQTEIFNKKGDSLIIVSNEDLFKSEKINELEKTINLRLKEDFEAMKISDAECFNRRKYYPNFKLKDMRLAFNDNSEISFEIEYNLTEDCFAVNSASTNLKILDLKEYFKD
jgi:hypothetical protein